MRALLCTDDGVLALSEEGLERVCCPGVEVYDVYVDGEVIYACTEDRGLIVVEGGKARVLVGGSCWRLYPTGRVLVASVEGPRLYAVEGGRAMLVGDYSGYAERLGWWFPHGPPHITDLAFYKGVILASVEVGHLLKGASMDSLRPIGFREDQHNLLALDDKLLIATASGVYYTRDLENFRLAPGSQGYFHALEDCGDLIIGHVMSYKPLRISRNRGESWEAVDIKLPPPTFGATSVACIGGRRILYATTSALTIDLDKLEARTLAEDIPMTRRIVILGT